MLGRELRETEALVAADEEEFGARPTSSARRIRVAAGVSILLGLMVTAAILLSSAGASQRHASFTGVQGLDEEKPVLVRSLSLPVKTCTTSGCTVQSLGLTIDQNWRWYHDKEGKNCEDCGNKDCSKCSFGELVDYAGSYGVSVDGDAVTLAKKSSRLYVLEPAGKEYFAFKLLGKEISFDIDVSALRCGVNSALYTVEMDTDGGYDGGASIGTGYCDAQCPRGMKTIGGKPDTGNTPQCCTEMDLWEGNRRAAAFTAHPCQLKGGGEVVGNYVCEGDACKSSSAKGEGVCDGLGCDVNPYRDGLLNFYQFHDSNVSSAKPITVTTQFIAVDGELTEVRRTYRQDGKVFEIPPVKLEGREINSTLTDEYCEAEAQDFGGAPAKSFTSKHGGIKSLGKSLARGNILVISLWNDATGHMLWLDGTMNNGTNPGEARGPCKDEDNSHGLKDSSVTFSNFRVGDIGTTAAAAERGSLLACILLSFLTALVFAHQQ